MTFGAVDKRVESVALGEADAVRRRRALVEWWWGMG